MGVLKAIKDAGICAEANSLYEVRKCLEIGFSGSQIVFNGVVKKPEDLEYAIDNELYLIKSIACMSLTISTKFLVV